MMMKIKWSPPTWKSVGSSLILFIIGLIWSRFNPIVGIAIAGIGYLDLLIGVFVEGW